MTVTVLLLTGCGAQRSTRSPSTSAAGPHPSAPGRTNDSPSTSAAQTAAIPSHYDPSRDAEADIRAALAQAATDHRAVLIDFGADWCPDCRVLGTMLHSAKVEPLLQAHFHVVAVDVGKFDHNLDVARRYINLSTSGVPALVVLDSTGAVKVATNDGAFANARSMKADEVAAFLNRWTPPTG